MSDNCSAPDRICRSAVFFSRSEASEGTAAKPQRRKTWNYRRAKEFVSSRCFMERLLQRGRLYPFRYSPSRPIRQRLSFPFIEALPPRRCAARSLKTETAMDYYGRFFGAGNGSRPSALAILRQSLPPIPGIRSNSAVGRCCRSPTTSYPVRFSSRRSQGRSFKSASFVSMPREKQTGAHRAIA